MPRSMAKRQKQVGGKKEAPLAIVGSGGLGNNQHNEILTPKDAKFQRYSELLNVFFEFQILHQ